MPAFEPEIGSLWEEYNDVDIADVVVDVEAPDLLPTYSYRVPEPMAPAVAVGTCVHVPFGGQEKLGYVFGRRRIPTADPLTRRLRDIIAPVEGAITFTQEQADVARWIADRYLCDLAAAVRCIAPANMSSKVVTTATLVNPDIRAADMGDAFAQAHIVETLRALGGQADLGDLRDAARASAFSAAYGALLRHGIMREKREISRPPVVTRMARAYSLGAAANSLSGRISPEGRRLIDALAEFTRIGQTPVMREPLLDAASCTAASLKTLVGKGIVQVQEVPVRRSPTVVSGKRTVAPRLTAEQRAAADQLGYLISVARHAGSLENPPTALLHGVTASGKTEVYLDAIARTLDAGRSAVVLVPEIALTTQVVEIFTGRFGDEVAVLHSRLSEGERHDEWRRLQESHARIAVGARSAVFAPVENVGLVVVDEEHEASYKQESLPRYHARDVAIERARLSRAAVVLGSATPSIETYHSALKGDISLVSMPHRIDNRALPTVEVVDMREEWKEHKALFSHRLIEEMGERLALHQQVILFLNRRGYSQFVLCRDCGYVARCPNCEVSLAYHAAWGVLKCHHCDYDRRAPSRCPSCNSERVKGFGVGTERVEEEVLKYFPSARVVRMDRDTTARKGAHAGILGRFRRHEVDILIGTQMVAKGLDFPNVTLVGVISADTSINMPDFRAGERTFQLLTQVAGRAGRGEHPGTVVVQTFSPDHYSVQTAMRQDYEGFYAKEIAFREELRYPPYSRLANLICTDESADAARQRSEALAATLKAAVGSAVQLIGPAPAPLARLKNLFRFHIVLRAPVDAPLSDMVRQALSQMPATERHGITVDIDPMSMA